MLKHGYLKQQEEIKCFNSALLNSEAKKKTEV